MDCVIPSHSVRPFCAAIGCMARIGKELYLDFHALEGLTLRTLNDAKSAFASFQWEPAFFERCTTPPPVHSVASKNRKRRQPPQPQPSLTDDSEETRYTCRVPLRALSTIVRPRKGILSLRIRNEISENHVYLSFEFRLQKDETFLRVVHRIGVADAEGIMTIASKEGCSEIIAPPKNLLNMLEPLKGASEVAVIVNDTAKVVTATSFHHGDAVAAASTNHNVILHQSTAALLKTETSIGCDEFFEFDFRDDRTFGEEDDDDDQEDTAHATTADITPPPDVNEMVTLVFGIKEAKAMLQFCSQSHLDQDLRVSISFHWGGKPIMLETDAEHFSAHLIMATLDHKLLGGIRPSARTTTN